MAPKKKRQHAALGLAPDITVGDGLHKMLASTLQSLRRHGPPAKSASPEAVHRFRVGVRRLRSGLSAFGDALPARQRRALSDRLRAAAQRYGKVREWDVFLAHTATPMRAILPEEPTLADIERMVISARQRALPPGDNLKNAVDAIEDAIDNSPWLHRPSRAFATLWETPLRDYAATLLDSRHRHLRQRIKSVDLTDQMAFHQLRIHVKKLRYPTELLRSLFDEKLTSAYLERLVAMQDVLGTMNDALIAHGLMSELILPSTAQHLIAGWIAHQTERSRRHFSSVGRAFRQAEPFWEG